LPGKLFAKAKERAAGLSVCWPGGLFLFSHRQMAFNNRPAVMADRRGLVAAPGLRGTSLL